MSVSYNIKYAIWVRYGFLVILDKDKEMAALYYYSYVSARKQLQALQSKTRNVHEARNEKRPPWPS